jgi:hypothetical protein
MLIQILSTINMKRKCLKYIFFLPHFENPAFKFQASFVASGNRTDISLDDPNFWQKWAKKAEIDIDAISGRVSIYFGNIIEIF